jgi:hypothetical protein
VYKNSLVNRRRTKEKEKKIGRKAINQILAEKARSYARSYARTFIVKKQKRERERERENEGDIKCLAGYQIKLSKKEENKLLGSVAAPQDHT